jgi:Leucine-rich repeat (LRR) protein
MFVMMRSNFGKFWNTADKNDIDLLINLFYSLKNMNEDDEVKDDIIYSQSQLYDSVNILIKYSDNVDIIEFVEKFFNPKYKQSLEYIESNLNYKNIIHNLKHNFIFFWIGIDNSKKNKFVNILNEFFNSLNTDEKKIIFDGITFNNFNPVNCFDSCKKNVLQLINHTYFLNMYKIITIRENKTEVKINTLICDNINLSNDKIEISHEITNIKITRCQITNLDWLHDNINIIDCSNNSITQLDNLPRSVKILLCGNNAITNLDNLPDSIEYLDAHTNIINCFRTLPKSLKYLKCSFNQITEITNLPNSLIYLDCSKNQISHIDNLPQSLNFLDCSKNKINEWTKLPIYLKEFICKSNNIKSIHNLPFGLKKLNLSNNYIKDVYSLNSNITHLNLQSNYGVKIYHMPNMIEDFIK